MNSKIDVRALMEKATPGEWCLDTGGDVTRDDGTTLLTREDAGMPLTESFANAELTAALHNLFRAHAGEIAAMGRDAERYRWLRDVGCIVGFSGSIENHVVLTFPVINADGWAGCERPLDAAIDAALACGPGVGE